MQPETATTENFFDIDSPEEYRCNVFRYHSGLSRLYIRVFRGESDAPNFYIFFPDVGYMDCPMNWQGVAFERADADECLSLMVKVGILADMMLDDPDTREALAESFHLYKVKTSTDTVVRIIAGEATRMDDIPDDLK